MDREKKFKAWDKNKKKFDENVVYIYETFYYYLGSCNESNNKNIIELEYIDNQEDFELVQFTGLKDKNKVEIYDGDIVEFTQDESYQTDCGTEYETYIDVGVIKFNETRCGYDIWVEAGEYWAEDVEDVFNYDENFKVIGNIYENPELLENKENGSECNY